MAGGGHTTTGSVLEAMVLPALTHGGYMYAKHVNIGVRMGGGKQVIDILATRDKDSFLISMKWQQVSGTVEQKVPFEAMCLAEAILSAPDKYKKAYIVLGGPGWKLRDFFVQGGLDKHLRYADAVDVMTLESSVARANSGAL